MTEMNINMGKRLRASTEKDIHVGCGTRESWLVTQVGTSAPIASYRLRVHAMAFARAVAFRGHGDVVVHEIDGRITRHLRPSLTYPTTLD
jgi:hypothetical protein